MKTALQCLILPVLAVTVFVSSSVVIADDLDDKIEITGEIRARMEGDDRDFNSDTELYNFTLLRTRVNLDFYPDSPVRIFLQVQDSRLMGDPELGSGRLNNDSNLGLHQAYMLVECMLIDGVYFKIGRFEYYKGNHRVLGNVGWSNVGRTWDGAVAGYAAHNLTAEIFGFEINEKFPQIDDDVLLVGGYVEIEDPDIDLFILWDRDNAKNQNDKARLSRLTAGLYRYGEFSRFSYTTDLAYQFGKQDYDARDIAAYLATLEIGYSFDTESPLYVAVGADVASGDDKVTDDKANTYNDLYYTGHKFRGHMDFFVNPAGFDRSDYGLHDFFLKGRFEPSEKLGLNGHFHLFQTNKEFMSEVDGSETSSLGSEVDLFALCRCRDRFSVQVGGSVFFPSEDWKGEDADPSYWVYLQTTARF